MEAWYKNPFEFLLSGSKMLSLFLSLSLSIHLYTPPFTRTMRILHDKHRWHGSTCRLFVTVHSFLIMCWARATCERVHRFEGVVKCGDMWWRLTLSLFLFFFFLFFASSANFGSNFENRGLIAAEVAKFDNFRFWIMESFSELLDY